MESVSISDKLFNYNRNTILKLRDMFLASSLGPRTISLIVHGSCLFQKVDDDGFADIDLELVLFGAGANDYIKIREILKQFSIKIECQLRYLEEIQSPENLIRLANYKLFMYFAYANGICLIGENVYRKLVKGLTDRQIKQSLLICAQLAFKDIRKVYFSEKCNAYIVNKNIKLVFLEILMYLGVLDYRELGNQVYFQEDKNGYVNLILKQYDNLLTYSEKETMRLFIENYRLKQVYEPIFPIVEKIMNRFGRDIYQRGISMGVKLRN